MMHHIAHTHRAHSKEEGFTMIELMVTLSIVVLVTGIILVKYGSFNSSVLLKSQAYNIAFDLRQTQSVAVSVRGFGGTFRNAYGMYFDLSADSHYQLFLDNPSYSNDFPAQYNPDANEAVGTPNELDPRFVLKNICVQTASTRSCYTDDPKTTGESINNGLTNLAISFKRPNFDAQFYSPAVSNIVSAEIIIGPRDDDMFSKKIMVYQSGQIAVE